MKKQDALTALKRIEALADSEDAVYIRELYECVKKGRRILNPDDYIDLLLGLAADAEEEIQEAVYAAVDFVTEQYC